MKNIALCFDHADNATLAGMLPSGDGQVVWSSADGTVARGNRFAFRRRRSAPLDAARASVTDAYEFLVDRWEPGDRLYLFGAGRGAFCARALTRVLGTVGVLRGPDIAGWTAADFRQYVLDTYAMPRTRRSPSDWQRVARLAAQLCGRDHLTVDVEYLGLWDTVAVPGVPRMTTQEPLPNVHAARHAVAIDGGVGPYGVQSLSPTADGVEEVWFRGAHCDVAGGPHACAPLSDIALDWVLDGAVRAGAVVDRHLGPAPAAVDALAGSAHPVSFRKLPEDAVVHASVQAYLHAHPSYWRRLPACVVWADPEWADRSERLVSAPSSPAAAPALAVAS